LKRVDKLVDDAANSEILSLLDMFLGYHQVRCREKMRKRQVSSHNSGHTALYECQRDSRMQDVLFRE
jgi:hypothetical protein